MNHSSIPVRVWCVIAILVSLLLSSSTARAQENNSPRNNSTNQVDKAGKDTQPAANSPEQNSQPDKQTAEDTSGGQIAKKNNSFHSPKIFFKNLLHDQKEIWLSPLKL